MSRAWASASLALFDNVPAVPASRRFAAAHAALGTRHILFLGQAPSRSTESIWFRSCFSEVSMQEQGQRKQFLGHFVNAAHRPKNQILQRAQAGAKWRGVQIRRMLLRNLQSNAFRNRKEFLKACTAYRSFKRVFCLFLLGNGCIRSSGL